jgi:predicted Zn-dependent protease
MTRSLNNNPRESFKASFFRSSCTAIALGTSLLFGSASRAMAQVPGSDATGGDLLFSALGDELQRSMSLKLADLAPPYFVQYSVDDSMTHRLSAAYGALVSSTFSRGRVLYGQVRVGSYELDNSNFAGRGGFGGRSLGGGTQLPTDDDYLALRHAVWSATDSWYKSSAAALAQKRAYMRERNVGDRPHDFAQPDSPMSALQNRAAWSFNQAPWEDYVRKISQRFGEYPQIQDADVNLTVGAETRYLVNSENFRLRYPVTGVSLRITAEVQANDGERIADSLEYFARVPEQLPKVETVLGDVVKLADRLSAASQAAILEDYTGPVLVDGLAAGQLFRQLLAQGLAAQVDPVGAVRRSDAANGLETRFGKRILPVTFHIFDDPRAAEFQDMQLAGHYLFDDEGIPPERVEIVVDGKLQGLVTSRAPSKFFAKSNGHGRRGGGSSATPAIGCLFIESTKGATQEELKQELLDAADAEGLKFGLRVTHLRNRAASSAGFPGGFARRGAEGGSSSRLVGDPISLYKVHVPDGREEPVRGCEFVDLDVRSLRRIIAAGKDQTVHNSVGGAASSVIAPAVLFEELELIRIKQEAAKKPILAAPHARRGPL